LHPTIVAQLVHSVGCFFAFLWHKPSYVWTVY
jgi:hypothetical protein